PNVAGRRRSEARSTSRPTETGRERRSGCRCGPRHSGRPRENDDRPRFVRCRLEGTAGAVGEGARAGEGTQHVLLRPPALRVPCLETSARGEREAGVVDTEGVEAPVPRDVEAGEPRTERA